MPCSRTQRSTSAPAPGSRGSTFANATIRSGAAATKRGERVVRLRRRPEQPVVGEDDRDVDAELVHSGDELLRAVRVPARLVDVEVDHAGHLSGDACRTRDPLGQLEARQRLRPARAPGGVPASASLDEPLELEREARLGLVARRLERLGRPVGELDREPEGRRIERRAAERSR